MNFLGNLIILPLQYGISVLAINRIVSCGVSNTTISFLNVFYSCPTIDSDIFSSRIVLRLALTLFT